MPDAPGRDPQLNKYRFAVLLYFANLQHPQCLLRDLKANVISGKGQSIDPFRILLIGGSGVMGQHLNGSRPLALGELFQQFRRKVHIQEEIPGRVRKAAGGIRLDTLFLDEGFGSLDEDSLEQAIRVLAGLTEGDRLVGIISHVGALKERVDRQVVVRKARSGGSTVELIV